MRHNTVVDHCSRVPLIYVGMDNAFFVDLIARRPNCPDLVTRVAIGPKIQQRPFKLKKKAPH